ncbi:MAG TPA: hypothetical protein VIR02_13800 [Anaerolineales bacterium]
MRHPPPTATSPKPRVFNYSLDWRFLLPVAQPQKICLLLEENLDFSQTLEQVGIHVSQQRSLSELRDRKDDRFQLLVMPFGLPTAWAGSRHQDRVEFYVSIRRFIDSGGHLLVGFNNILNFSAKPQNIYQTSTPRRLAGELGQADFKSVKMYGAMPNLRIPEYLFDLDSRALDFAARNRFRRKPAVLQALRVLSATIGLQRITNFLPCYFAVAAA